jgi:hypothetical protein
MPAPHLITKSAGLRAGTDKEEILNEPNDESLDALVLLRCPFDDV